MNRVIKATGEIRRLHLIGIYSYRLNYVDPETGKKYSEPMLENGKFIRIRMNNENRLREPALEVEIPPGLKGLRYCLFCDRFMFENVCPFDFKPTVRVEFYRYEVE